jgi:hypothetical protein
VGGVPVLAEGQNIWLEGGARPVELAAMVKAGTGNKAAYAKLPTVTERGPTGGHPDDGPGDGRGELHRVANWTS